MTTDDLDSANTGWILVSVFPEAQAMSVHISEVCGVASPRNHEQISELLLNSGFRILVMETWESLDTIVKKARRQWERDSWRA